jgi:hypothetical protein
MTPVLSYSSDFMRNGRQSTTENTFQSSLPLQNVNTLKIHHGSYLIEPDNTLTAVDATTVLPLEASHSYTSHTRMSDIWRSSTDPQLHEAALL